MNYPVPGDHINFSTTQNMADWVSPWRKSGGLLSVCSAPRSHCPFFFLCLPAYVRSRQPCFAWPLCLSLTAGGCGSRGRHRRQHTSFGDWLGPWRLHPIYDPLPLFFSISVFGLAIAGSSRSLVPGLACLACLAVTLA